MNKPKIMTWQTYKKKYDPNIIYVQDSTKGWIRTFVKPTMLRAGFNFRQQDINLDDRKPKQILLEDFKDIVNKAELIVYFVYHPTRSYAGYFTDLDVYFKLKPNEKL